jgi:protein-tyrosine phosphatase
MPFAIAFLLFAAACAAEAAARGGWAWLLLWPAVSFLVVGVAYAGGGPRLLGKRPATGAIHPAAVGTLLPYFLLAWGGWHAVTRLRGSRDASLVAGALWVGRRPRVCDLPADVTAVVDLTSEFRPARGVAGGRYAYLSFPILDGHVPPPARLVEIARAVAAQPGVVYLHCAQGHGRAAMVAACVLMARGLAADPAAAVAMVRAVRPRIRLTRSQWAVIRRAAGELTAGHAVAARNDLLPNDLERPRPAPSS